MTRAATEFQELMLSAVARMKRELSYNPTRFIQMVADHGAVGAAQVLLKGRDASDGFTTLWEHNRLDMSVEATVLLPWFEDLFTTKEIATARRRLIAHRFDVNDFLARASRNPPSWTTGLPPVPLTPFVNIMPPEWRRTPVRTRRE